MRLDTTGAQLPGLISKRNTASDVWADTAYRSKANERLLADNALAHRKKPKGKPNVARANGIKSKVRAAVEHVFAVRKGRWAWSSAPSASPERR